MTKLTGKLSVLFLFIFLSSPAHAVCGSWLFQIISYLRSNDSVGVNCVGSDGNGLQTFSVTPKGASPDIIITGNSVISGVGNTALARAMIREMIVKVPPDERSKYNVQALSALAQKMEPSVFPIVNQKSGEILGAALHVGSYFISPLHVVYGLSMTDLALLSFDKVHGTVELFPLQGFIAPKLQWEEASKRYIAGPYEDIVLLNVPGLASRIGFSEDQVDDSRYNFPVLDLSFPKGISNRLQTTAFFDDKAGVASFAEKMGLASQPDTEEDHLLVFSLKGQNHSSSGGVVFNADNERWAGMEICKLDAKGLIFALQADRVLKIVTELVETRSVTSVEWPSEKIFFTYQDKCDPIGPRGSAGGK